MDARWNRGGAYSREQQIYIAGIFSDYSMRLKVLGLIEYVCSGATTPHVNVSECSHRLQQMMCRLSCVAKSCAD